MSIATMCRNRGSGKRARDPPYRNESSYLRVRAGGAAARAGIAAGRPTRRRARRVVRTVRARVS